jgi:phenylacetate-CoA ligase
MLIVLGVNVFPSAVRDVVAEHPDVTGAVNIVLADPGPKVAPPLRVEVEHAAGAADLAELQEELERRIRSRLSVSATVRMVEPGSLPGLSVSPAARSGVGRP